MRTVGCVAVLCWLIVLTPLTAAEPSRDREKGIVSFKPLGEQKAIPDRYRLDEHSFPYELEPKTTLVASEVDIFTHRFPSAIETPEKANNTVHGEFYRPQGEGRFPGVVVLDILAGDGQVARLVATFLAQRRIAALYVHMPYYGPRREPGSKVRLLSPDYKHSVDAMRQAVLDVRRAAAWLAERADVDTKRLGVVGVSLGSFIGSLAAEMEPRFARVAVVLGGGGLIDAYYDHPRARAIRLIWEQLGGTKKMLQDLLAPVDPLTYAANLKDRKVLMIAAKNDEVVPPRMAEALWKAAGEPPIVWYDCGHYTALLFVAPALDRVARHFAE
jgi:dienelactone hydrolase